MFKVLSMWKRLFPSHFQAAILSPSAGISTNLLLEDLTAHALFQGNCLFLINLIYPEC